MIESAPQAPRSLLLEAALQFYKRGIRVTPLRPRNKKPIHDAWPTLLFDEQGLEREFRNDGNIGALLGEPSNGLGDVDLDCIESNRLADAFLPPTDGSFGHGVRPRSHRLYRVTPKDRGTTKFQDPRKRDDEKGQTLVELRMTGGQTMVPPSIHPCGEAVEWFDNGEPAAVEHDTLLLAVTKVAAASLLARYWPNGNRHDAALALAGALMRAGWSLEQTDHFLFEVARAANDEEASARRADVRTTAKKLATGQAATGIPTCRKIFRHDIWDKISQWLHLRAEFDWLEPIGLDSSPVPRLPGGVFEEAPWLDKMVAAVAASTETPIELATYFGLAAVATCVQKKYDVLVHRSRYEPLNVWVCPDLESGGGKSPVVTAMTAPLVDWEDLEAERSKPTILKMDAERKTLEARIQALRKQAARQEDLERYRNLQNQIEQLTVELPEVPTSVKMWVQDLTPEHLPQVLAANRGRISMINDEGGFFDTVAGRYNKGIPNFDAHLQSYSGTPIRVGRVSRQGDTVRKPAQTIAISPHPDTLQALAARTQFIARGLFARFLFALPKSNLGYRTNEGPPISDEVTRNYANGINALLSIPDLETKHLELEPEAVAAWKEYGQYVEREMRPGGRFESKLMKPSASKLPGQAIRVAGNLHCAVHAIDRSKDHGHREHHKITRATMDHALELVEVAAAHALAVLELIQETPELHAGRQLWQWIQRNAKPQFTFRDAHQALRGSFPLAANLEPAFIVLDQRNYIRKLPPQGSGPGRPSEVYEVNPALVEKWRKAA
jgi:hypothetical protein